MNHEAMTPDFSEAVDFEDSQVPPGIYKVRIDSWATKTAKASGAPYIQWKLVIFGADGDYARQNNRPLFLTTMLSGKGAGVLKSLAIAALGEVLTSWGAEWQNQFIGKEIQIKAVKNINPNTGKEGFPDVRSISALRQ